LKSLKQKTISGLYWSSIDGIASQGVQFTIGIVLARILSPHEFGLIGMLTIFIAIAQSFIDSGFGTALIRKKSCSQKDYSTIFYFNITVGILFYFLLFISAGPLSAFFKEPQLKQILRVLGFGLILNSVAMIQKVILTKNINFKLQTRVSIISSISSGLISIWMAYAGYGVWSLVGLTLSRFGFTALFLWIWTNWKPSLIFSIESLKELFAFGSKLLISGLINTAQINIYSLIIGKYFSAVQLGYYTRADQFQEVPSKNLSSIIGRVSIPLLSSIQDDLPKVRKTYQQITKSIMLITFLAMIGMAAIAKPLILFLIGEKWLPSVLYLQMLCFVGMFYPLHSLNLNLLNVLGRSDLFLRLEIIKQILVIPTIVIGILFGLKIMIFGMMTNAVIGFYLNSFWSGKFIDYSTMNQVKDIIPSFCLALLVGFVVYIIGLVFSSSSLFILIIQLAVGSILAISTAEFFKMNDYIFIKKIILEKIKRK